jgi:hypothetical protein
MGGNRIAFGSRTARKLTMECGLDFARFGPGAWNGPRIGAMIAIIRTISQC